MGILQSGPLGPFRKKTGPIVGRNHRGKNVITSLPEETIKPPTKLQLETQNKFGLLSHFLSNIGELANIGFKKYVKGNSVANAAFKYNYQRAFVKNGDIDELQYSKLVYSRGRVVTPDEVHLTVTTGSITFSWLPQNQSAYCQFTDLASFLVYNTTKKLAVIAINAVSRYAHAYEIAIPVDYLGDRLHCYMNFDSANGKLTGDSMYVGEVVV
uniref:DUF6266 family protein n=1 Tax=Pedobacter schmidteae TaxID=2201271 RepID=UPI000EAF2566|nr:DUF6266 family protein [Pedobacter schmidteae]